MKANIQPKIEKLLKSLAKSEPKFITLFDCDAKGCPATKKKDRTDLALKHKEIKEFSIKNDCSVAIGLFGFIFYNDVKKYRYLGYWHEGSIEVERKA